MKIMSRLILILVMLSILIPGVAQAQEPGSVECADLYSQWIADTQADDYIRAVFDIIMFDFDSDADTPQVLSRSIHTMSLQPDGIPECAINFHKNIITQGMDKYSVSGIGFWFYERRDTRNAETIQMLAAILAEINRRNGNYAIIYCYVVADDMQPPDVVTYCADYPFEPTTTEPR
jgi:hypothetical protein